MSNISDPIAEVLLVELADNVASLAVDDHHGVLADSEITPAIESLCAVSRDVCFHIGGAKYANSEQIDLAASSFNMAADVVDYLCDSRTLSERDRLMSQNLRDRAARLRGTF